MKNIISTLTFVTSSFMFITGHSQEFSNPKQLFDPLPFGFSHMASAPANSQFIFVAGQGGEENKEGRLSPDFRTQVRQSLRNIETALRTKNLSLNAVVKVTTLVVAHDDAKLQVIIDEFNRAWPDKKFPVNTLIPVPRLALDNMLIEIDAIAIAK